LAVMGLFDRKPTVAKLPAGGWVDVEILNHAIPLRRGKHHFWLEREPDNPPGWLGYLDANAARRYAAILDGITVPIRVSAQVGYGTAMVGLAEPAALEEWVLQHRLG
jgi:hypothetical protein